MLLSPPAATARPRNFGLMCMPPHNEAPAPHFALTAKTATAMG